MTGALCRGDPAADEVIESLAHLDQRARRELIDAALRAHRSEHGPLDRLLEEASTVPDWVQPERIERAGRLLRRAGFLGIVALGMKSLVLGYAAPAGNKPVALSGKLVTRARGRLAETARFVSAVCAPSAMHPFAAGWSTTFKVRLMHAHVRRLCSQDPRWDDHLYGTPINQHDMLASILLFSCVFVHGIRQLGIVVSDEEAEDFQHLFRWVGAVIGVSDELLSEDVADATRKALFIRLTQHRPDADSRALVTALLRLPLDQARTFAELGAAEAQFHLGQGLCRYLIGDALADDLGLDRDPTRYLGPLLRRAVGLVEAVRISHGPLARWLEAWGAWVLDAAAAQDASHELARLRLPPSLRGGILTG